MLCIGKEVRVPTRNIARRNATCWVMLCIKMEGDTPH